MVKPLVTAIEMGYGHLRPAAALANHLKTEVMQMEAPPLGSRRDRAFWSGVRKLYEPLTRASQAPRVGRPMRALLNTITAIPPLSAGGDLSGATQGTRWMQSAAKAGVGRRLAEHLRQTGTPLLTTFYAAAILAELHGAERLHCVITDSDINRVWAPPDSKRTSITYFAPTEPARRRMEAYGVPRSRIRVTGYPLPGELVGMDRGALKRNFRTRMEHIERKAGAALIVFAVGGAGAQVPLARQIVGGMEKRIRDGTLRLALVAGSRKEVASALSAELAARGLAGHAGTELLYDPDVFSYFRRFNELLSRADALWSKPSELVFFAALGLPFIAAPPVGAHEECNLRWATDRGAALPQHDPTAAGEWLSQWIEDGVLASAAEAGMCLPQMGLYEIADLADAA
jgi:UDP-N-acetylglucosamine:LPS N-acetylglucosamine transferase